MEKIQANLNPETVQRVASIANKPVTRGIDKMINQCLDELQKVKKNCGEKPGDTESESENE